MSDDSSLSPAFIAGVVISIVCSCCNSLGMGLQKLTHRRLEGVPPAARAYWRDRQWLLGLLAMTVASVCSLGNYALLGQSRAAAMASLTIVTNAVMSKYYLGEAFTVVDACSAAAIMAGIVVAVIFGSSAGGTNQQDLPDLLESINRPAAGAMAGGLVLVLCLFKGVIIYAVRRGAARSALEARAEAVSRAFLAGLFSGLTGFLAKAVVVSVESMVRTHSADDLRRWQLWLMALGLPLSIVFQLRELNGGLRRFDAMELVPMYQAGIVIWGVAYGWGFYQENLYLANLPFDEIMFAVGVGISICGIALLSLKPRAAAGAAAAAEGALLLVEGGKATAEVLLTGGAVGGGEGGGAELAYSQLPDGGPADGPGGAAAAPDAKAPPHAQLQRGISTASRRMTSTAASDLAMPGAGFIEAVTALAPASIARFVAPPEDVPGEGSSPERASLLR